MPALNNDQLSKVAIESHNLYLNFRNPLVPFPPESVAFWCYLLAVQKQARIKGDCLELGVQHGGSAFLSTLSCSNNEKQYLVDLKKTELFEQKFNSLPKIYAERVLFIEKSTTSDDVGFLRQKKYRFIHIDAGHTYNSVCTDVENFGDLLGRNGVVCCDDFFTNRWPDVTTAVLDTYPKLELRPLALVNRKLYLTRAMDFEYYYKLLEATSSAASVFGDVRRTEVHLRGQTLWNIQISVKTEVARAPMG